MNIYQNCFINTQRELCVDPLFQMKYKLESRSYLLLRRSEKSNSSLISESYNLTQISKLLDSKAREVIAAIQKDVIGISNNNDYERYRIAYKETKDVVNSILAQVKEYL